MPDEPLGADQPLAPDRPEAKTIIAPGYTFGTVTDQIATVVLSAKTPIFWMANFAVGFGLLLLFLWAVALLFLGERHAPLLEEREPLSTGRRLLAVVALIILLLCFMPIPIRLRS